LLRECYCPAKFPHRVAVFECVGGWGGVCWVGLIVRMGLGRTKAVAVFVFYWVV
jgi:hypothetical protein